ncbi:uncharacterized protein LOC131302976 [Rhododendron vialii]|uniref:uncharacterized protein LOC131302976 n=1 Tax=Rhododendron vialii TaxID=182163 RepID=UPI00265D912A|nr:uncharacterized protein LOC131302976 [Rhododendron vialii]
MNTETTQASTGPKLAPKTIRKIITVQKRLLPSVRRRGLGLEVFTSDFTGEESDDEPENDWRTPIISFLKRPGLQEATDYFTKWAEAVPLKSVDQQEVIKVIEERIIHRFGLPEHLVADRGTIFMGEQVVNFATQQNIIISNSTPYYAQGNGQAESTNRTFVNIIEKMVEDNPRAWHELLSEALWAYRTSKKEATNITPYMLVYGHDPVLPMDVAVKSARIAYQNGLTPADYTQAMLMELEDLDEVRLAALDLMLVQKRRVARSYDKRVRKKSFIEGDLVWKVIFPLGEKNPRYGKWSPIWEGPYQIAQVLRGNVYLLMDLNGGLSKHLTNGKYLKHHYPTMWEMRDVG